MPTPSTDCATRSAARQRALPAHPRRWLLCWFLPALLTSCAQPGPIVRSQIDPPPAGLAAECWAGPPYPAGAVPLGELLEVIAGRERAAADCRGRHRGLVEAWPR